ncbi:MAG: GGDEF domain-containing protein [Planctomycetota bacterium]
MSNAGRHAPGPTAGEPATAAELATLWRLARRLHECESVAVAEAAARAAAAGHGSPAMERAIADTVRPALENIRERERLRSLAIHDPLTGLANRRFLEEELGRQIERQAAAGRPLAVALIDLDHFRDYNRRHGHLAGDLALTSLAGLLQGCRREGDVPCRYGGDEFVLIMPDATAPEAGARLEPLRDRLAEAAVQHEGRRVEPVTASIGVAECPADGGGLATLLAAADAAMYAAKQRGRNRICLARDARHEA